MEREEVERADGRALELARELWNVRGNEWYMVVHSKVFDGRTYRVPLNWPWTLIEVFENGKFLFNLCATIREQWVPPTDIAIARRLWIEADEVGFLEHATTSAEDYDEH